MGNKSDSVTPSVSDEESGDAFTDGDFSDTDDDYLECDDQPKIGNLPVNESINKEFNMTNDTISESADSADDSRSGDEVKLNGIKRSNGTEIRRDSHGDNNTSIVGIIGNQHNYAEQRLAARRAARAEAREIRMRELERQQRDQEDHADKAYDMYNGTPRVAESLARRTSGRLSALGSGLSPRRSSEDSNDEPLTTKELRHELKEVEEKFRQAMILNAQLDNDKAALGYQLELLKDRIEELQQQYAQLQREHKEKCSAHERLKREHATLERSAAAAAAGVAARDAAAAAAGRAFVAAAVTDLPGFGSLPPLALVPLDHADQLAVDGEATLDVRLQNLIDSKLALESEVRKLKLQLNDERAARQNGVANHHDQEYENELESLRRACAEAKARAARGEAEAALQAAAAARLDASLARVRARTADLEDTEQALKTERRKLQRETREALNRVEELETENSHLTKRLDKLKNAKSALLKDL